MVLGRRQNGVGDRRPIRPSEVYGMNNSLSAVHFHLDSASHAGVEDGRVSASSREPVHGEQKRLDVADSVVARPMSPFGVATPMRQRVFAFSKPGVACLVRAHCTAKTPGARNLGDPLGFLAYAQPSERRGIHLPEELSMYHNIESHLPNGRISQYNNRTR